MALPDSTPLQNQLREYLIRRTPSDGTATYIKSRHIAANFGASTKQIGITMAALEKEHSSQFRMERHGGTSDGTTWRLEAQE